MRARNLKPSFFKNDLLAELPYEGRLLFAGLWCLADRSGRLEDRPKRIKGELFAFDSVDIDKLLDQLDRHGFIKRYEVGGARFMWIPAFLKHQHPHHQEKESVLPHHPLDSGSVPSTKNPGFEVDASNENPEQARDKPRITPHSHGGQIGLNPESFNLNPESKHLDRSAQHYAPEFESFWREYPRKIGKGAAYKAWGKLKPPIRDCLSALQWQKKSDQWTKEHGQFIPHPATWLNQRRWEDEKPMTKMAWRDMTESELADYLGVEK